MQRVCQRGGGMHAEETHSTADCILHAFKLMNKRNTHTHTHKDNS